MDTAPRLAYVKTLFDVRAVQAVRDDAERCRWGECDDCTHLLRVVDEAASLDQGRVVLVARPCEKWIQAQTATRTFETTGLPEGFHVETWLPTVTWFGSWGLLGAKDCAKTLAYDAWKSGEAARYISCAHWWKLPWTDAMFADLAAATYVVFDNFDRGAPTEKQIDWVYRYALRRQMTGNKTVFRISGDPPQRHAIETLRWDELTTAARA